MVFVCHTKVKTEPETEILKRKAKHIPVMQFSHTIAELFDLVGCLILLFICCYKFTHLSDLCVSEPLLTSNRDYLRIVNNNVQVESLCRLVGRRLSEYRNNIRNVLRLFMFKIKKKKK